MNFFSSKPPGCREFADLHLIKYQAEEESYLFVQLLSKKSVQGKLNVTMKNTEDKLLFKLITYCIHAISDTDTEMWIRVLKMYCVKLQTLNIKDSFLTLDKDWTVWKMSTWV